MRYALIVLGLIGGAYLFSPTAADAVVCARGVVRAGCAGPRGAVVTTRPAVRRGPVVVRRRVY